MYTRFIDITRIKIDVLELVLKLRTTFESKAARTLSKSEGSIVVIVSHKVTSHDTFRHLYILSYFTIEHLIAQTPLGLFRSIEVSPL